MLELYHHGTSVCAAKVRLALGEKRLEWQGHYVDILKNEQFAPDYLKLNPKHVVPTLVHDGRVVRESTLIGEYLDEIFPDPPLKPASPFDRVTMRLWTKRLDEEVHPACGIVTFAISHRHAVLEHPPAVAEAYVNAAAPAERERRRLRLAQGIDAPGPAASLRIYDRFLADMETALAPAPWLAEVGVIPYVNRLDMLGLSLMWEETRPHLTDWFRRVKARPGFEAAMFRYVPPPLAAMMRQRGAASVPAVRATLKDASA
jgi:glutathione S-transferase